MSEPFVAEIRIFGFNFAPRGWAMCQGQLMPISQNTALFSLLGTNFGGNGTSTFGLPDLQGRAPIHVGGSSGAGPGLSSYVIGEKSGSEQVTLLTNQLPPHSHPMQATTDGSNVVGDPSNAFFAQTGNPAYVPNPGSTTPMDPNIVQPALAGNQAHENRQPFLVMNFCIALQGVFPSRN